MHFLRRVRVRGRWTLDQSWPCPACPDSRCRSPISLRAGPQSRTRGQEQARPVPTVGRMAGAPEQNFCAVDARSYLDQTRCRLTVIIGSTRPGRAGLPVAEWFTARARKHPRFDVRVADLAEIGLPLLDEPEHPRYQRYVHPHTLKWSAIVDASDALVMVTPEYNHGMPGALKNAIDYLSQEWAYKPVGFVSYGGVAAGTRAVAQLHQVVTTLKMTPLVEAVHIPFFTQFIDDGERFVGNDVLDDAVDVMLGELLRVHATMEPLRSLLSAA
jgi:NAD(P)H-dependent FMN reductase